MSRRALLTYFFACLLTFQGPACALACINASAASVDAPAEEMPCHGAGTSDTDRGAPERDSTAEGGCGCEPPTETIHSKGQNHSESVGQFAGPDLPLAVARDLDREQQSARRARRFDPLLCIPPPDILLHKSTLLI